MAIDGIFVSFLTSELNHSFGQYRLEKISQYEHLFILQFYHDKIRKYLKIDLSARFCSAYETNDKSLPSSENSQFLNTLKKHLESGLLQDITQYLTDRTMIFNFTTYDFIEGPVQKQLIFELMGKHANLYLVSNGIIIDCYKKSFVTEGRHLIPGATFEHFLSNKVSAHDYVFNPVLSPKEISDTYLGISLRLAKKLSETPIKPFDLTFTPLLNIELNRVYFTPIFDNDSNIFFKSLSEALSNRKFEEMRVNAKYERFITSNIQKHETRLNTLEKQLFEAREGYVFLDYGNSIYGSGLDLKQKVTSLENIPLNPLKTLNENAQFFFKKYQKSKRAIAHLEEQINKQKDLIEALLELSQNLLHCQPKDLSEFEKNLIPFGYKGIKQVHKKRPEKPKILSTKIDGITYYVGKHALQNEYLVHTLAQKNYYWFHVKNASGSHVVVDTQDLNESIIRTASMLAAYHSSQKHSSSIPVDYTQVKFVSKISGKPGYFVKYKNEKTMFIDIDESLIKSFFN